MTAILVVDDVLTLAEQYAYDLKRLGGYETSVASGGDQALEQVNRVPFDCIILDLEMPGTDGFEVLRRLRERRIQTPVIVYTGTGDYDRCVQAVQLGASGFVDKGESMLRVFHEVESVLERDRLRGRVESLSAQLDRERLLVGTSVAMENVRKAIRRVARIPSPVLILGESGTGKELVAREIHGYAVPEQPFVAINCAALPENLIESELFGHERGAFTGAAKTRNGAFEAAGKGTLMLDEVGELPMQMQAKLLRVLEQREVTRVGGNKPISVQARVVTATNRDLDLEVSRGHFREDLLYRLNVHVIRTPPLRERLSDIPELVDHFVISICARFGIREKRIASDVMETLMRHTWRRNNVRELRNVLERLIVATDGPEITIGEVPEGMLGGDSPSGNDGVRTFAERKAEAERQIIVAALDRNDWHISNTAQELGLADHSSLLKIMRRHGVTRN